MAMIVIVTEAQHELLRDAVGTMKGIVDHPQTMRALDELFQRLNMAFPAHSAATIDTRAIVPGT